jgi:O-antigen ligase
MQGVWDIAHNTHLEFASEMGIPLTVAMSIAWIAAVIILLRGLQGRRRDAFAPLSALVVSLIALLHSSIDFSLQIAGYSIVVFALLGVGLAQSLRPDDSELLKETRTRTSSARDRRCGADRAH